MNKNKIIKIISIGMMISSLISCSEAFEVQKTTSTLTESKDDKTFVVIKNDEEYEKKHFTFRDNSYIRLY